MTEAARVLLEAMREDGTAAYFRLSADEVRDAILAIEEESRLLALASHRPVTFQRIDGTGRAALPEDSLSPASERVKTGPPIEEQSRAGAEAELLALRPVVEAAARAVDARRERAVPAVGELDELAVAVDDWRALSGQAASGEEGS